MTPAEYTLANGGGTFRADTLLPVAPNDGYAVALIPNEGSRQCAPVESAIGPTIARVRYDFPSAEYVGTWIDGGVCYVDPVAILPDRESALTLARTFGQLAVWSFAESAELRVAS